MVYKKLFVVVLCIGLIGCSFKKVGYTAIGSVAGAGIGYSYHKEPKETVIGGVAGGAVGAIVATVQENTENKKYKAGFDKGYKQAQIDIAIENWNENTGRCANKMIEGYKHLSTFKVPERLQDNVIYESHYVTLEDYR